MTRDFITNMSRPYSMKKLIYIFLLLSTAAHAQYVQHFPHGNATSIDSFKGSLDIDHDFILSKFNAPARTVVLTPGVNGKVDTMSLPAGVSYTAGYGLTLVANQFVADSIFLATKLWVNNQIAAIPTTDTSLLKHKADSINLDGYTTLYQNSLKLTANPSITGATKTKITYDSKGLVTSGTDATVADITGLQTALDSNKKKNDSTNSRTGYTTLYQNSLKLNITDTTGKWFPANSCININSSQTSAGCGSYSVNNSTNYGLNILDSTTQNVLIGKNITANSGAQSFGHTVVGHNATPFGSTGFGTVLIGNAAASISTGQSASISGTTLVGSQTYGSGTAIGYKDTAMLYQNAIVGSLNAATGVLGNGPVSILGNRCKSRPSLTNAGSGVVGCHVMIGDVLWETGYINYLNGGGCGIGHDFVAGFACSGINTAYAVDISNNRRQGYFGWFDSDGGIDYINDSGFINNWWLGGPDSGSSIHPITLSIPSRIGTNLAGVNWTLRGSRGTGNAASGDIVFQTGATTTSGTALHAWTNRFTIKGNGDLAIPTTASTINPDSLFAMNLGLVRTFALSSWAGSANITTLGTIGTGTWQGNLISSTYGGTGVNNAGRTLAINTNSGTVAFSAASKTVTFAKSLTFDGTDGQTMTFPSTSATIARTDAGQTFTGSNIFFNSSTTLGVGLEIQLGNSSSKGLGLDYYNINNVAVWPLGVTKSGTNYAILVANNGTSVQYNATDNIEMNISDVTKVALLNTGHFNVGTSATTDIPSAQMAVNSTTSGFAPPRMTTTQKNAISSPAEGLIVYDLTLHKLCVYTGSVWETVTSL
jgi:hypothetical protein